jgi:D-glycerate 3-kinase
LDDWLDTFLAKERLPDSFRLTVTRVCRPLADRAVTWWAQAGRPVVVGLCGAQGSGKTTIAEVTAQLLQRAGVAAVAVSLDDFYLGRAARARVAERIHALLRVRGPPATHDVPLACSVLDALTVPGVTRLPAFDKASDERAPASSWRVVQGPVDVILLEGWCVGARPEPAERLASPLNELERKEDPGATWRNYVNRQLGATYGDLFRRLDRLVLLQAPGFEVVHAWREEQEAKLRARTQLGMTEAEVGRFIQHYERLTRWILEEMPDRADWTVRLSADRTPL